MESALTAVQEIFARPDASAARDKGMVVLIGEWEAAYAPLRAIR